MVLLLDKSRVLEVPKILFKLGWSDESFESIDEWWSLDSNDRWGEWIELVFDVDLEGKLNDDDTDSSSLWWLVELKEE